MLLASLVIAAAPFTVQANPMAAQVDYSNNGASAAQIVRDLAEMTGAQIEASEAMEADLVAIHTAKRPLAEAMDAIARVASGAWIQQGERYTLTPDIARRNRERTQHEEKRMKALADSIQRLRMLPRENYKDEEGNQMEPTAASLAWADIFSRISANQVMLLEPNQRVVFASRPNAMQLPLPNITGSVNALVAEHNQMYGEMPGLGMEVLPDELSDDPTMNKIMQISQKYGGMPRGRVTEAPAKVLLIFENQSPMWAGMMSYINVELVLFNAQGKIIMQDSQQIYPESGEGGYFGSVAIAATAVDVVGTPPRTEPQETPEDKKLKELYASLGIDPENPVKLEIPQPTKEIAQLSMRNRMGMIFFQQPRPSDELLAIVRHPTQFDPMGLTDGAYYVAFGKALNVPVAACIPDETINLGYMNEPTDSGFISMVHGREVPIAKTKEWVEFSPADPHKARERSDRSALERLIAQFEQKGRVSLDELADYALVNRPVSYDVVAAPARTILMPSIEGGGLMGLMTGALSNWSVLRFYGSLDRSKRQALRRGETILFANLSQTEKTHLFPLIYGTDANLFNPEPADEQMIKNDFGPFMYRMFMQGGLNGGSYLDEPTEAAPNGLVPQGRVESMIKNDYCLKPLGSDGKPVQFMANMGLQEMTMYQTMQQMMGNLGSEASDIMPPISDVMVGERLEMMLTIRPTPQARATHILNDDSFTDTKAYSLNQLPSGAQASYEAAQKEMSVFQKLMMMGFGMGREEGTPPPP